MVDVNWSHDEDRLLAAEITEVGSEDDGPGVPHAWKAIIIGDGDGGYEEDLVGMKGTLEFNSAYTLDGGAVSAGTKVYLRVRGWWDKKGVIFDIAGLYRDCEDHGDDGDGGDGGGDGEEDGDCDDDCSFCCHSYSMGVTHRQMMGDNYPSSSVCPDRSSVYPLMSCDQIYYSLETGFLSSPRKFLQGFLSEGDFKNGVELVPPSCIDDLRNFVVRANCHLGTPALLRKFVPLAPLSLCRGCQDVPGDPLPYYPEPGVPGYQDDPPVLQPPSDGPGIPFLPPGDFLLPQLPPPSFAPVIPGDPVIPPRLQPPVFGVGPFQPPGVIPGFPGFPGSPRRPVVIIRDECEKEADLACGEPGSMFNWAQCWHDIFVACLRRRRRLRARPGSRHGGFFRPSSSGMIVPFVNHRSGFISSVVPPAGSVDAIPLLPSDGLSFLGKSVSRFSMDTPNSISLSHWTGYFGRRPFDNHLVRFHRFYPWEGLFELSVDPWLYELVESLGGGGAGWWTLGVESVTLSSTPIHNWSPPAAYLYLLDNTTMGPITITGLSIGQVDGQEVWIKNVSVSQNIILSWESGSSSSDNRFSNSPAIGSDVILPGGRVFYQYSTVVNRWVKVV